MGKDTITKIGNLYKLQTLISEEFYAFALLLTAGDSHAGLLVKALFTVPAHVVMMRAFLWSGFNVFAALFVGKNIY